MSFRLCTYPNCNSKRVTGEFCSKHGYNHRKGSRQGVKSREWMATSQYVGVHRKYKHKNWTAQIKHNGVIIALGTFAEEIEAAKAYDKKAVEIYGDRARTNFTFPADREESLVENFSEG